MKTITAFIMQGDTVASLIIISLTICLGLILGKLTIKGFSIGITFVLFIGIALSSLGFTVDNKLIGLMKDFGLVLFIFTVGLQVGPSFFSSFRKGGLQLNLLAVAIVVLGVVTSQASKTPNGNQRGGLPYTEQEGYFM